MLLVVAGEARNAGAETQRWKARSTKAGGNSGMQRAAVESEGGEDGERDGRGKAEMGCLVVGIAGGSVQWSGGGGSVVGGVSRQAWEGCNKSRRRHSEVDLTTRLRRANDRGRAANSGPSIDTPTWPGPRSRSFYYSTGHATPERFL